MKAPTNTDVAESPAKRSLIQKLKIPGIILGIVAAEWLMAYVAMPSSAPAAPTMPVAEATTEGDSHDAHAAADSAEAAPAADDAAHHEAKDHGKKKEKAEDKGHGEKKDAGHGDAHGDKGEKPAGPKHSDAEEVDLGNYTVSGFQPASNSTLFITFHLFGTVRHKYVDELSQRVDENQHRIRDNVIVIIRSAEITDLTDAGLGLIKRRILETTNKTLGKPLLQEVVFSDFSFIEQ